MATQSEMEANRGTTRERPDPARWRILAVLLVVIFMSLISVSIVNVALPSIQSGLDASQSDIQWVLSGYALTFGIVLVAAGRAGDVMGRGGIFVVGVIVFTLSSIAAGLAPTPDLLNVARFIQGIGSGLVNPQGVGMIQQYFRGAERGKAFGYFGSAVGVSVAIGPVLGGLLINLGGPDLGWRLTFLVNVPVGIVAVILALLWFPRPLIRRAKTTDAAAAAPAGRSRSMDLVGAMLLGLAVLSLLFPFVESAASALIWLLFPLGILLVVAWVLWERRYARRGRSPMVDLKIFSTRSFANGTVIVGLYFLGMTSVWVLVALYMQDGLGLSALQAGMVGVPSAILSALSAHWAGSRVMRYGRKIVIGGLFIGLFGLAASIAVVLLTEAGFISEWWLLLSLSFIGIAQGSVISPNQTLTLAEVPLDYAGSSGAIMQTGQRIGTSIGIAVITAAAFAILAISSWPVAFAVGFGLIGLVVLSALGVAFKDQRDRVRAVAAS
ncbi:drug resistance transporter, EmrB/QacA subfamily [Paramicrobacterium humi]|uniref:Drug resistance transporter, EmrB/QacA subfamily n=1 Tax=Paramicrobacterium humi TaxID=640635 RepID=A0A1H4T0X8_9MICO|nr:MFS transporter [Microbacterium humi]SEC49834.1 drug resistance transporter, EmrB/QacA subfamily [Microbacterium humi]